MVTSDVPLGKRDPAITQGASADGRDLTMPACQNCGAHVSKRYVRVVTPDEHDAPRVCPQCEDMTRDADGEVRETRDD